MTISITGILRSTRTQRVILVLEELQLSYELIPVDLLKGEHQSPLFIAEKHPFGKIPVLEEDGIKLIESRAICRYLVVKYGSPLTIPTNPEDLGRFEEADSIGASYFEPVVSGLGYEKIFKKQRGHGEPDEHAVEALLKRLTTCLDHFERTLSSQEGLAGDHFSLVDIFYAPFVDFLWSRLGLQQEIQSRPNVRAWWDRVTSRPSWKALMARR
ncbi:hypothetical protein MGN70_012015 [Eutypa lata]|nr:hypothetical protein MGN70_012015 [Eutypa lata]